MERDELADFIILDRRYSKKYPFLFTLLDSVTFSGYDVEFFKTKTSMKLDIEMSLLIKEVKITFPSASGQSGEDAKNNAAKLALEILSQHCYTVRYIDHKFVEFQDIMTILANPMTAETSNKIKSNLLIHSDVDDNLQESGSSATLEKNSPNISDSGNYHGESLGCKMLKMMGWSGGGLGKDGSGIEEPIQVSQISGTYGLGHKKRKDEAKGLQMINEKKTDGSVLKKKSVPQTLAQPTQYENINEEMFTNAIYVLLDEFKDKSQDRELVFSDKFTKSKRKIIHEVAEKFELSSISFGRNSSRHIVLFKIFSSSEFVEELLRKEDVSNSSINYEVIPPSGEKSSSSP